MAIHFTGTKRGWLAGLLLTMCLGLAGAARAAGQLHFRPGFNLFSPQDDIQFGREASTEADRQLPLVKDLVVLNYVNDLGRRLALLAPVNSDYAWTFKVVNSQDINAFALPGGFIYVNWGTLEAAEGEAQIAGVIAHEIGHVVMRHGTHQASQIMLAQFPLAILGGFLGQSASPGAQLAQMGITFGVNSLLLKNSRGAESQADEVGTYILYMAGYDPHAMAQFFEIIEKKYPQRTVEFFSDHPNPENRIHKVDALIPQLGPERESKTSSAEFEAVKKRLLGMPAPPKARPGPRTSAGPPKPPPAPSNRLVLYRGEGYVLAHPENWTVAASGRDVTLAPSGAFLAGASGEPAQAYGASITRYQPSSRKRRRWGLIDATAELVDSLRQSNPNMRVIRQQGLKIGGRPALRTILENDSPLEGQKERDILVTLRSGEGLLALILIAPENALDTYQPTFDAMLKNFELH